jgi:hypothetical protein
MMEFVTAVDIGSPIGIERIIMISLASDPRDCCVAVRWLALDGS